MNESAPKPDDVTPASIAETRAHMSETINAIEQRLSPAHVREQVIEQIDTARGQMRAQVKEEIQELEKTVRTTVSAEILDIKKNVIGEISALKGALTKELNEAKTAVRAATIGKVETMVQNASDTMYETRTTMITTIRENPIPTALIGLGIAWLLMNGTSSGRRVRGRAGEIGTGALNRARDIGGDAAIGVRELAGNAGSSVSTLAHNASDTVGSLAHSASDKVSHLAHDASQTVGNLAHTASDTASSLAQNASQLAQNAGQTVGNFAQNATQTVGNLAHQAAGTASSLAIQTRDGAYSVEQRFERVLHDNPLAVGAAVFALGTAIGLALPSTERENSLMGSTRDRLLEQAEHLAHDAVQTAQESLSQVLGTPENGQSGRAHADTSAA